MDLKVIGIPNKLQWTARSSAGFNKLGFGVGHGSPFLICTRRTSSTMEMQRGLSYNSSSLWRISNPKFSNSKSSASFIRKLKQTEMTPPFSSSSSSSYSSSSSDLIDTSVPWWFGGHGNCRSEGRNNHFSYTVMEERREGTRIGDSSYSSSLASMNRAFSSMVFIIRELHNYTLVHKQLVTDVHQDMNASFCWLFQQIFYSTPTLMLSLMLLLANFAVHSIPATTQQDQSADPAGAWSKIVEEAELMKAATRHRALMNKDTLQQMVAPVTPSPHVEECVEHLKTELTYQTAVSEDPDNSLLLCNYAQFLYLVGRDHDRAEHYLRRAVEVSPVDVECLSLYADFLWRAKNDLCSAEKTYLMAIDQEPDNSSLAANYANFLWNTGGEDTCLIN